METVHKTSTEKNRRRTGRKESIWTIKHIKLSRARCSSVSLYPFQELVPSILAPSSFPPTAARSFGKLGEEGTRLSRFFCCFVFRHCTQNRVFMETGSRERNLAVCRTIHRRSSLSPEAPSRVPPSGQKDHHTSSRSGSEIWQMHKPTEPYGTASGDRRDV